MKPRFSSFAEFLAALFRGDIDREKLRLACWSGSGLVTIELEPENSIEDAEVLVEATTAEEFAFDVIKALGGEGRMA